MEDRILTALDMYSELIKRNIEGLSRLFDVGTPQDHDALNEMIIPAFPFHLSLDELSLLVDNWREGIKKSIAAARTQKIMDERNITDFTK